VGRHERRRDWALIAIAFAFGVGVGAAVALVILYELVAWAARQP